MLELALAAHNQVHHRGDPMLAIKETRLLILNARHAENNPENVAVQPGDMTSSSLFVYSYRYFLLCDKLRIPKVPVQ